RSPFLAEEIFHLPRLRRRHILQELCERDCFRLLDRFSRSAGLVSCLATHDAINLSVGRLCERRSDRASRGAAWARVAMRVSWTRLRTFRTSLLGLDDTQCKRGSAASPRL